MTGKTCERVKITMWELVTFPLLGGNGAMRLGLLRCVWVMAAVNIELNKVIQ